MRPLTFTWTGRAMVPKSTALPLAISQFVTGEDYRLKARLDRNWAFHRYYMKAVHEAWANLPEALAPHFQTPDRLRYWALIKCCYAREKSVTLQTETDAELLVAFLLADADDNQQIEQFGRVVKVWTANSQEADAMDETEFNSSARAVLEFLCELIGIDVDSLLANAGRAA